MMEINRRGEQTGMARSGLHQLLRHLGQAIGGQSTDAELLERFTRERDQTAFEVLVWRHGSMVMNVCRRVLRHEQDAEDAFQAAFLTLVRKAPQVTKREAIGSWLHTVAYRIALELRTTVVKRRGREAALVDAPARENPTALLWNDLKPLLDAEINRLPARFRAPFVLCCLEGKTNEEAARQLGCPTGTVQSRLSRARARLRAGLSGKGIISASLLTAATARRGVGAGVSSGLIDKTTRAALHTATGEISTADVSLRVIQLSEGVIHTMFWSKMRILAATILIIGLSGTGVGLGVRWTQPAHAQEPWQPVVDPAPTVFSPSWVTFKPDQGFVFQGVSAAGQDEAKNRADSRANLKKLAEAMLAYEKKNGGFPKPAIYSEDGRPLLSWRVALLPYLGFDHVYKQFHLNEPWDSPNNKRLLGFIPAVYITVGTNTWGQDIATLYQVIVGSGAAFENHKRFKSANFTDLPGKTLLIAEAASAVPWTQPEDIVYDPDKPPPALGSMFRDVFHAAMGDGKVLTFRKDLDPRVLKALITRAGGEAVNFVSFTVPEMPVPLEEKLDVSKLRRENELLHEAVQRAQAEVDSLKAEVLRRLQRGGDVAEPGQLREENDRLRQTLQRMQKEAKGLKDEIERLKDTERKSSLESLHE
jgi:RNA polymerase sigma factor (sigma-70 family)